MAWSFHHTQMAASPHRRLAGPVGLRKRREIEIGKIGIGTLRSIRLPEYLKLASLNRACQPGREEAMIVGGIDPNRALRRIVAVIGGGAPDRGDIGRAGAADGASQQ